MKINDAIETTLQFVRSVNKYMETMAPWKLAKTDLNSAEKVLYTAAESLRISALLLAPIMPNRTMIVLEIFGAEETSLEWGQLISGKTLKNHKPLFPRIDINKLNNDLKKSNATKSDLLNVITFDDFKNIELKTGKVIAVEKVEKADKLLKLEVEIGDEKRQIISGIAEYYSPEDLLNNMIVVVTNLKPATIFGNESYGMLLAAKKGKDLTLVTVDDGNVSSGMDIY
jgi:methionyl-tRNA synthetase